MTNKLEESIERYTRLFNERKAKELAEAKTEIEKPKPSAKIIPLPLFNKEAPPAPNAVLRSSLFSAIQSKDRRFLDNELVASVDGIQVKLLGKQLNQDDLEVLLSLENLAREHSDTLTCEVSERGLLKLLGRRSGHTNESALSESLVRLQQPITVIMGRFEYSGGFIHNLYKNDLTKRYMIELNPRLGALLRSGWTALGIDTRRQLAGKPLALWLQAFYATHDKPYAYKIETLRELSGSQTAELYKFRQNLKKALTDWATTGDIQGWQIDENDNLHITKPKKIGRKPRK